MNRKLVVGLMLSLALLLVGAGVFRSQEPPEPPEPPAALAAPAAPEPFESFFGEGSGWLGVALSDVTAEKARELKLASEFGALVEKVEPDSPAAKAGLSKGDVILAFAGERVRSVAQLRRLVRETPAGRTVTLEVSRAGQTRNLSVKVEPAKDRFAFHLRGPEIHVPDLPMRDFKLQLFTPGAVLGISGDDLTSQLAEYFGVKQGKGVLVREVMLGSAADKAHLKAGDVIVAVDGKEVKSVSELRHTLPRDFEGTRKVTLTIVRDRREQAVPVELQPPEPLTPRHMAQLGNLGISAQELARVRAEIESHKAEIQQAAERAAREWTQEKRRALEEMRRALELHRQELREGEIIRHDRQPGSRIILNDVV